MCGIAGFFGLGDQSDLRSMAQAIAHRGPDGEGFYQDPTRPVFLAHRRLSIVDLADGYQPMTNEDKSIWVTYNGEIYNHVELRRELEAKGHRFATDHSDTEILVHGWEEWGTELPLKLNGMFGFYRVSHHSQRSSHSFDLLLSTFHLFPHTKGGYCLLHYKKERPQTVQY